MSTTTLSTNLLGRKAVLTRKVGVRQRPGPEEKAKDMKAWGTGAEVEIVYIHATMYTVVYGLLALDGTIREATNESIRVKIEEDPWGNKGKVERMI